MKSHLVILCLVTSALALAGCVTTKVAPLFPTSNTTVAQRGALAPEVEPEPSSHLPSRSVVANGMACRSE